jgi:spermidine synthase
VLAGFVLVPHLGTRWIFLAVSALLALAALVANREVDVSSIEADLAPDREPSGVRAALPRGWTGYAVLAGAALLAVEVVAGRMAAVALGASLYTWTSVIGVVLGGMAIGAAAGGWLADVFAPRVLLTTLLLVAAVAVGTMLWGIEWVGAAEDFVEKPSPGLSWPTATLAATALAFLFPALAIGSLSPVVIRSALADREADGRIVGSLYAWGTIGAVAATVLAGYVLVPWLGLERVVLLVVLLLAVAAARLQPYLTFVYVGLLLLGLAVLGYGSDELRHTVLLRMSPADEAPSVYATDSRYFRVRVREVHERWVRLEETPDVDTLLTQPLLEGSVDWEAGRSRLYWDRNDDLTVVKLARLRLTMASPGDREAVARLRGILGHEHRFLSLDRLIHGYVDLQDPSWLGYEYERIYGAVIERVRPPGGPVRALFIGGGAYAFQRRMLAREEGRFSCVTAEIDPEVTRAARAELGLEDDPRHEIVHEDARTYVERLPVTIDTDAHGFDFVFGDAFNDLTVPFHLTTLEFAAALKARMEWDGVYLLNVIDIYDSGLFVGAMLNTLREAFDHVYLLSVKPRRDDARDTFVVVASDRPVPLSGLEDDWGRPLGVTHYDAAEIDTLRRAAGRLVLTDDRAPVETLLAPVVRERSK